MRQFANVGEWLDSDPPFEVTIIVLKAINRSSASYYKKELQKKKSELQKLDMAISAMKDAKIVVPAELKKAAETLRESISVLSQWLPYKKRASPTKTN